MKVVPDSNLVIAQVIPLPYSKAATYKMQQWLDRNVELLVPTLWSYEIVSTLRKATAATKLSSEQANAALESILALKIQEIAPTFELHRQALIWAEQLGQTVAYDAAFLALAEAQGAEFWTADQRLFDAAKNLNVAWIHSLNEIALN